MTQPVAPAAPAAQTPPTVAPSAGPARSTAADRAAALLSTLDKEDSPSEPAVESPKEPSPAGKTPPSSTAASGDETPAAREAAPDAAEAAKKRAADRAERIAKVRAAEETARAQRAERAKYRVAESEVEKLRARVAELEPMEQAWSSPLSMFEWAEKKGLKSDEVVKVLKEKLSDPEAIARRQAATVEERISAELAKNRQEIADLRQQLAEERRQATEQSEGQRRAIEFQSLVSDKATEYPLTARFQKKYGHNGLVAFANRWVAPTLPEDYSLEELHDHVEQIIEEFQMGEAEAAVPGTAAAPSKNNGAGQPEVTISNRAAAGRETVVEAIPLHKLPKAERVRKLKEQYERE